jgi:hypothetical protein
MEIWTNRGKFNGIARHEIFPRKGDAVWDPSRRVMKDDVCIRNSNGFVRAVLHQDEEVIVHWYDTPFDRQSSQILDFSEFSGKWTDKYGGGYWLDDSSIPAR